MKNETYTVKLNSEVKEKWQDLISGVMNDYNLTTIGEVYPVLIDIINKNDSHVSPALDNYIQTIRINLDTALKNVLAIDSVYKSTIENNEQALNDAKANLLLQLEKEINTNKDLEKQLSAARSELDQANKEIDRLQKENDRLRKDTQTQKEILSLLSELKEGKKQEEAAAEQS